jgi:hypothetical protein
MSLAFLIARSIFRKEMVFKELVFFQKANVRAKRVWERNARSSKSRYYKRIKNSKINQKNLKEFKTIKQWQYQ